MKKKQSNRSPSEWRPIAFAGYTLIAMTFGVAGVWAAVAKLDKAIIATGFVETETNRKTVQHLEGGIVREILVKEGDHVAEGQVLFRLEQVQAEANNELLSNQLNSALALEARLIAERDGAQEISWPKELKDRLAEPTLSHILDDQIHQFEERRGSLEGQKKIVQSRIVQLNTEIDGISIEKSSTEKQTDYINEELVGLRELAGKNLVPVTRVYAMERERTRLEGDFGRGCGGYRESAKFDCGNEYSNPGTHPKISGGGCVQSARRASKDCRSARAIVGFAGCRQSVSDNCAPGRYGAEFESLHDWPGSPRR